MRTSYFNVQQKLDLFCISSIKLDVVKYRVGILQLINEVTKKVTSLELKDK